jgi:hypothetical protein
MTTLLTLVTVPAARRQFAKKLSAIGFAGGIAAIAAMLLLGLHT